MKISPLHRESVGIASLFVKFSVRKPGIRNCSDMIKLLDICKIND